VEKGWFGRHGGKRYGKGMIGLPLLGGKSNRERMRGGGRNVPIREAAHGENGEAAGSKSVGEETLPGKNTLHGSLRSSGVKYVGGRDNHEDETHNREKVQKDDRRSHKPLKLSSLLRRSQVDFKLGLGLDDRNTVGP